jgi:hypothetical protein
VRFRRLPAALVLACGFAACAPLFASDETSRYFEQLRRRGLFAVAEHYALTRLNDPQLEPAYRTELAVELSSTFAAHAATVGPEQRQELLARAADVVRESLQIQPALPRSALLRAQTGLVAARLGELLRWDATVAPHDHVLQQRAIQSLDDAARQLADEAARLDAALKSPRSRDIDLAPHETRRLLQGLRLELGDIERQRAMLLPTGTPDRASALVEAQTAYRESLTGATEPRHIARAKLGLADSTRLQRDVALAREMCAAIAGTPGMDADLQQAVIACRVRCDLDEGQPLAAAETLLDLRRTESVLTGELWLLQLQTLLALRNEAERRQDAELATQLNAEAELVLQRVDQQAGGSWSLWCLRLWAGDRSQRQYGAELDALITRARSEYLGGDAATATALFAEAIAAARTENHPDLAADLGYTLGSILLEREQFESAAETLSAAAQTAAQSERAASADLLAAYALGRHYEQQRSQSRRLAYTAALERHLERFGDRPTAGDATFMLAQLEEQRLQFSKALPLYLRLPTDHPRAAEATAGAARCQVQLLLRLKSLEQDWRPFHAGAVAVLSQRVSAWAADTEWTPAQAESLLSLVRLGLWGDPPDYRAAAALLEQLDARLAGQSEEVWRPYRQQAVPLKLVAWAGIGRSLQARQLLGTDAVREPTALLAVVQGLDQLAAGGPSAHFVDLTELLVDAVQRLESQREQLSPEQRQQFDQARVRAYLVSGRIDQALAVAAQIARQFATDPQRQRDLALLLQSSSQPGPQHAARVAWRKVESLTPAGSVDWLAARRQQIERSLVLGETAEAMKLLRVTKVLYPALGTPELQRQFADLESRLATKIAPP